MIAAIRHRGPDGEGTYIAPYAALGHVRLAIIDLAGGAQPMRADGLTVAFNGEIYNYRALRAELVSAGHQFRTQSDTEVILAIYRTYGWRGLSRLRGMYALALWDAQARTGYLARDPLGIKPLFIADMPGGLLFGSEAKAILAHGSIRAALDPAALHLLLNFRYLPGERTLFRGIRQLAPGMVLQWTPEAVSQLRLPKGPWQALPIGEALRNSVAAHMTADVEVGAYLSGGIDSAAIAALAKTHGLCRTFTLAVGDDPDEARNAEESARLLGLENMCEAPAEDPLERLMRLIHALEVPKVNSLQVSQLAALAARNVKVALSGLGGDELFYGYNAHRIMHRAAWVARASPRLAQRVLGASAAVVLRRMSAIEWREPERAAQMLASLEEWPRVYGLLRNVWDAPELRRRIYGPRFLDVELPDAFEELSQRWPGDPDPVAAMARFEWQEKLVNDLLWQEDRASMAEGLEVRVPFVDSPLVAAVNKVPCSVLIDGGRLKGHLRQLLTPQLPQSILARPKSGFQVDAPSFFQRHLRPLAEEHLSERALNERGLFNASFVRSILALPPRRDFRWHYFMLYQMLGTHLWLEAFEMPWTVDSNLT